MLAIRHQTIKNPSSDMDSLSNSQSDLDQTPSSGNSDSKKKTVTLVEQDTKKDNPAEPAPIRSHRNTSTPKRLICEI